MNYIEELKNWKDTPTKDKILAKELKKINEKNVEEYFGKTMTFGTAGIRGILGAGTNKINEFTIAAAAYAYAATLLKESPIVKKMGLVIAHDNRQNGALFAEITTKVFDHLGIKTYIFKNNEMAPTPMLSYAIRKLRAAGGVNITASHNPKEYNGFKVYSAQGSQLMPEITEKISKLMDKMNFLKVPYGLFKPTYISKNLTLDYINDVLAIRKRENDGKQLVVVYSALNGTGSKIAPYIFQKMDIEYYEVKKEMREDPLFKGLKSCNPEEEGAYVNSIKLARKKRADIIILTDPDADRVGLAVRTSVGSYRKINGNQTGAIVLNHLIRTKQFSTDGYVAQSIVTGNVTKEMAKRHGFQIKETHVGFKNIAEVIRKNPEQMIMGYEESYGQLIDAEVARDKDAFQGLVMLVEAANYLKTQNKTLIDELDMIGKMYGVHTSAQISKQLTDEETKDLLVKFAETRMIAGIHIEEVLDFTRRPVNGLEQTPLVKVVLENGTWIAMRPSGTEPKVKFYMETVGETQKESDKLIKQMTSYINGLISTLRKDNKIALKELEEGEKKSSKVVKETEQEEVIPEPVFEEQMQSEKQMLAEQKIKYNLEMQKQAQESPVKPTEKNESVKEKEKTQEFDPFEEFDKTQEVKIVKEEVKKEATPEVEKVPEFSLDTISPMPTAKTPSQMDPKQIAETKELKLQKTREIKLEAEKKAAERKELEKTKEVNVETLTSFEKLK